jgi:hypothetical protein
LLVESIRRGRFSARSIGGEICQFDLWEPQDDLAVGHGQTRKGWVVIAYLGYSRAGAGALTFSKQTEDLLFGIRRCLWSVDTGWLATYAKPQAKAEALHGHGTMADMSYPDATRMNSLLTEICKERGGVLAAIG